MTELWRCFVAVPLTDTLRAELASAVSGWRADPSLDGLRWGMPEQWHVTLAFLGSVAASDVPAIIGTVADVARTHDLAALRTGGLGAFPSRGRARVVWYGVADPAGALRSLALALHRALGIEAGDRFRPHVTLARARRDDVDVRSWIEGAVAPVGHIPCEEIQLVRSHLGSGPARYEVIAPAATGNVARV
jgi:2'-5' RNA ligase